MPSTSSSISAAAAAAAVSPAPTASPGNGGTINATSPFGDLSQLPHDSKRGDIIACVILILLLSGAFVAARFYTRMFITRNRIGSSEWLVLVAWIFALATTIPEICEVAYGMGAHVYDLTPGALNSAGINESQWISILFYSLSLTFSKLSILMLYIQIFYHSWVRPASFVLLALVGLSQIWVVYVVFSACTPLEAFWDTSIVGATCHPQAYWLSNQYQLIATDFMIFLLPLPVVWTLRVRVRQKVLLVFLFALGFFVCAISVIRIVLLMPLLDNAGPDFTYNSTPAYYWTTVEINLAIMVACAITLKPLISRFLPKLLSSHPYYQESGEGNPQSKDGSRSTAAAAAAGGGPRSIGGIFSRGRRGLLLRDPLATFGSIPSRPPVGSAADEDTQALHTLHSRAGSIVSTAGGSAADKSSAIVQNSKIDEEMATSSLHGEEEFAGHQGLQLDDLPPRSAIHSMSSDQTLKG